MLHGIWCAERPLFLDIRCCMLLDAHECSHNYLKTPQKSKVDLLHLKNNNKKNLNPSDEGSREHNIEQES